MAGKLLSIAFDVDNVLADTISTWCKSVYDITGKKINKDNIKSHKIVGSVRMSPKYIFQILDQIWENWKYLPMTEKKLPDKIIDIKSKGYYISIVTCRPKRSISFVKKWLKKNKIHYDKFTSLGPYKSKRLIKDNYLVDDAPEHISEFINSGRFGFIYDQPWNKKFNIENSLRIKSISEILSFLYRQD